MSRRGEACTRVDMLELRMEHRLRRAYEAANRLQVTRIASVPLFLVVGVSGKDFVFHAKFYPPSLPVDHDDLEVDAEFSDNDPSSKSSSCLSSSSIGLLSGQRKSCEAFNMPCWSSILFINKIIDACRAKYGFRAVSATCPPKKRIQSMSSGNVAKRTFKFGALSI